MSLNLRIVFSLLALTNFIVAMEFGTIVPNFYMAVICLGAMFVPSMLMRYRMRRLESDWRKSGGSKEIPPDDSMVTV